MTIKEAVRIHLDIFSTNKEEVQIQLFVGHNPLVWECRSTSDLLDGLLGELPVYLVETNHRRQIIRIIIDQPVWDEFLLNTAKESDFISKQELLYALEHKWDGMVTSIFDLVESMPPAKLQKRIGQWAGHEIGYCTCCGHWGSASDIWSGCGDDNYCPNCGAKIVEMSDELEDT